jgi:amidase
MDGMLAGEPWLYDPVTVPLPWRKHLAEKPARPLRIGYYVDDGYVMVQPPIEQAVVKAVQALQRAGHEGWWNLVVPAIVAYWLGSIVFEWNTKGHDYAYDLWLKGVLADGGSRCRKLCEAGDQPLIEGMLVGTEKDRLDVEQGEEVRVSKRGHPTHMLTYYACVIQVARRIRDYQKKYLARWHEARLDALIMPVQPYVGFRPKEWVRSSQYVG